MLAEPTVQFLGALGAIGSLDALASARRTGQTTN